MDAMGQLPDYEIDVTPVSVARWLTARDGALPPNMPAIGNAVPLSYLFFLRVQPAACISIHAALGRDPDRGLFGGVRYDAKAGVSVGDRLVASASITGRETAKSPAGQIAITTLRTNYMNASGDTAVVETVRMVDLPPGPSRPPIDGPPADPEMRQLADIGPCTPLQIAWMTVETGDLNPLHLDPDYARGRQFPNVVVPGTLLAPLIEATLQAAFGEPLGNFELRFRAASYPGEHLQLYTSDDDDGLRFELVGTGCVRASGRASPVGRQ